MTTFSRLKWQCRRGTRELELLLNHYLEVHYRQAAVEEQCAFRYLLQQEDPELYLLLLGEREPVGSAQKKVLEVLLSASHYSA